MRVLAYDTETTGLVNTKALPSDPSQPHLVQFAGILYDTELKREIATVMVIVKPDGWVIPKGAADVHGITTEIATECGVPLALALASFSNLVRISNDHVAHNEEFDQRVLQAQFHRLKRPFPAVNARCTKNLATPIVNLPPSDRMRAAGFNKPKPPTLTECVDFFFGEKLEGAHDALVDTRACLRVYLEILRRNQEGIAA